MKYRIVLFFTIVATAAASGYLLGLRHQTSYDLTPLAAVQAQSAPARPVRARECAAALVQGAYALNAGGALPSSTLGEYASVGIINFDGSGGVTLRTTQSFNGRIVPPSNIIGAYFINPDCAGRITLVTGAVFDIVAADGGREINLIQINNDSVLRGIAKRI